MADACDFARMCSALDFWALTDHAESMTESRWTESMESVRQCNAVAGDTKNPDMVTFMGFEWTQAGRTPEQHYGHKNVIFRNTGADDLPSRPIGSPFREAFSSIPLKVLASNFVSTAAVAGAGLSGTTAGGRSGGAATARRTRKAEKFIRDFRRGTAHPSYTTMDLFC